MSERALAIDIVRGWGLEFDGTGDPKEFVGRIEDTAATYGIRLDHIAGAMLFLLKGTALDWWHANPIEMKDWITFKRQLTLHFVPDIRTGQRSSKSLLPWNRENLKRRLDTCEQSGGGLTTLSNNRGFFTGTENLRTEQPLMKKPKLLTDCFRQKEDDMNFYPKESWKEDHGGLTTNPSEETTELQRGIQVEARLKQAHQRPGQLINYKRSVEGKLYHVKIDQQRLDQLSEDKTNQPAMNGQQLLPVGGSRQQEVVIDNHVESSCKDPLKFRTEKQEHVMELHPEGSSEEDNEVPIKNLSEETTEIPLVIQQEARWRQAQKRPGQQVCFEISAEGKDYRVDISRSGNINICQLKPEQVMDGQSEQPPTTRPQLLTDGGTPQQEEDQGVPLTNPSEENTEIPLVIQQEARWRQAHKRYGKQMAYKRTVEGKEYRIKIGRGGVLNICQLKPEQVMDDQTEQSPTDTDGGTRQQEDVMDLHSEESRKDDYRVPLTSPSDEATEIPLVIQQEARWRQSHKRPGKQMAYKRTLEGKEYRIKIGRSGALNICQLKPEQLNEPQIPLVIQQEARFKQTHKLPGQQVCYKRSVEGKEYRIKLSRSGNLSINQM